MDPFLLKNQEITGNFDWISGQSGKINTFLEKYFLVIKFLSVLLSVMYIFMYCYCLYSCVWRYEYLSATCLIVVWCIITAWISMFLKWLIYTGIKNSDFGKLTFVMSFSRLQMLLGASYKSLVSSFTNLKWSLF